MRDEACSSFGNPNRTSTIMTTRMPTAIEQQTPLWRTTFGDSPLIATAIHHGSLMRPELVEIFALDAASKLREEDPYTGYLTTVAPTQIVALHSRFEVDLNRERAQAVYRHPEDAWGLHLWKAPLSDELINRSLLTYDLFYRHLRFWLGTLIERYPRVAVLDLHSYNYRRSGAAGEPADPQLNPEVNLGTGSMDRERWAPIVERALHEFRTADYLGRQLDVRENVRFRGGYMSRWMHEHFPHSVCCLAIEFKKIFMDEWTGEVDRRQLAALRTVLSQVAHGILEELEYSESPPRAA